MVCLKLLVRRAAAFAPLVGQAKFLLVQCWTNAWLDFPCSCFYSSMGFSPLLNGIVTIGPFTTRGRRVSNQCDGEVRGVCSGDSLVNHLPIGRQTQTHTYAYFKTYDVLV